MPPTNLFKLFMSERGSVIKHLADRYIGIPLLFTIGLFINKKKPKPTSVGRIAVIRTAAIGDTVLLSGICQDLKHQYPEAHLVLITGPSNAGMASLMPNAVDEVLRLPVTDVLASIKQLRAAAPFDLVFDTGQWPRLDALYALACRARYRVGFNTPNQFKHYGFNKAVPHSDQVHEMENFRNLVRPFSSHKREHQPRLTIRPTDKIKQLLDEAGDVVVFHPWPGGANAWTKEWPTKSWCELAKRITALGYTIAVTGAPADAEPTQQLLTEARLGSQMRNLAGKLSLAETADLVQRAHSLISVNTGIMHIGSALNVPMVALHGPTSPRRWGPLSQRSVAVQPAGSGCGYLNLGFEYDGNPTDCMSRVGVDEVWDAFQAVRQTRASTV